MEIAFEDPEKPNFVGVSLFLLAIAIVLGLSFPTLAYFRIERCETDGAGDSQCASLKDTEEAKKEPEQVKAKAKDMKEGTEKGQAEANISNTKTEY